MNRISVASLGLAALLLAGNAHATDFQFYTETPLGTSMHDCPVGMPGCGAADVLGSTDILHPALPAHLDFSDDGIGLSVYANPGSIVLADYNPDQGGLGALFLDGDGMPLPEDSVTNPDNLVFGQSLIFEFDQEVQLFTSEHFNSDHNESFDGAFTLVVDDGAGGMFTMELAHTVMFTDVIGTKFEFIALSEIGDPNGDPFYVSALTVGATVPEPGTAILLGFGLVGLGATRKRAA